ncbi:MAG: serine protease [Pseudomonadota bacterium]
MTNQALSLIVATLMALFGCFGATVASADDRKFPSVVKRVKGSVVGIATYEPLRQPRTVLRGSGFVVGDGSFVITNDHVVQGGENTAQRRELRVLVGRGQRYQQRSVKVLSTDPAHDLALLEIEGIPLPPLRLDQNRRFLDEGTSIGMTGYPIGSILGLYVVTHRGIISAISPNAIPVPRASLLDAATVARRRFDVYQLDIIAFPGNSGSPVYDAQTGEVVGVLNSAYVKQTREQALSDPSGISFAIPAHYAQAMLERYVAEQQRR